MKEDYEDFVVYEEETVMKLFSQAKDFIERMVELLKNNNL